MPGSPLGLHQATPQELRARLEAERIGEPFLIYRDDGGEQRIVALRDAPARLTIGRSPDADVCLSWDSGASRLHAQLERLGSHWVVSDDGLSRNGTFIRGERVSGRHRLEDADALQVGNTTIAFRDPASQPSGTTVTGAGLHGFVSVTDAQRRVLISLCRPFKGGGQYAVPAGNQQIADELVLSVAAVKTHLRLLYDKFGIEDLPQREKRLQLVAHTFAAGVVTDRDL
jgi:pSer/pThr/pTyr-binding forkhead associated (FHA) protein